jgi:methyl-accepting chemotaxis protein WspA
MAAMHTIVNTTDKAMRHDKEASQEGYAAARRLMLLILAGSALVGLGITLGMSLGISRGLRTMGGVAKQIALGNIGQHVGYQAKDEVGMLATAFNTMIENLSGLVHQVQKSGIQVTTSATHLAASGKQLESMMTQQVASTQEVVATAKEIAATSQELARTMDEVTGLSQDAATSAESGHTGLTRMEETMQTMESASRTIADKLTAIRERAVNITTVIATITKVADQTNLLSLNAAIEAEKAGEYGQGFAVVAQEIRRLADQTAVATLDIEHLVQEMTSAVSAGVTGMEDFAHEVHQGAEDVRTVGTQLGQIIDQVQALTPRFEVVSKGMQAQAEGAQQTADSLHTSTRATEQLNGAARGLHAEIARFNGQT